MVSLRVVEPVAVTVVCEVLAVEGVVADPVVPPEPTGAPVAEAVPGAFAEFGSVAVEVVSDCVVANATPGTATAVPIPSAIAKAPVRPMYLAYRLLTIVFAGAGAGAGVM
jgi:hypothetical protein